ncbi:MAG: hypothetical protein J5608_01610 [Alphaproteobacteria bacterium]|nr:hypothetical protein [Alphaproteobacteria bacterium]
MKKIGTNFLVLSLPAIVALFPYSMANAALRISNNALVNSQIQMNAERAAILAAQNAEPQPARVITTNNGEKITVSNEEMNACQSIYPNGVFDWLQPTSGRNKGGPATCVANIELRAYKGTAYTVLASAWLAAGDSMNCNIDDFTEITPSGMQYTYPADNPPTEEEVAAVMAQENKSHAGFKILAASLVGGIGGNLVGSNDPGKDSAIGLDKGKLKTTAIGALGGAALMTASTQVNDYKAGSAILSTGMNAAAGAVAGNVLGSGDDVIKFGPCKLGDRDTTCLYGSVTRDAGSAQKYDTNHNLFYDFTNKRTLQCDKDSSGGFKNCRAGPAVTDIEFGDIKVEQNDIASSTFYNDKIKPAGNCKVSTTYEFNEKDKDIKKASNKSACNILQITSATAAGNRIAVFIEDTNNAHRKAFGYKNWEEAKNALGLKGKTDVDMYDTQGKKLENVDFANFTPAWQSADDSDAVDFGNKARTKATLMGAGGGAALGAISGVAGANAEIQQRWQAEMENYKASLKDLSCSTGGRYLAGYNTIVVIPEMKTQQ